MNINDIITEHTLYIDSTLEEFINKFCNTTGFDRTITKDRFVLGSWYEGYLYCLLLGINLNRRHIQGYAKKTEKARNWSTNYKDQYKYCIAKLIQRPDVLKELQINERFEIDENFKDIKFLLDKIKEICDEFSIGGVLYLKERYEKDDNLFYGYDALKNIYKETLIKKEEN